MVTFNENIDIVKLPINDQPDGKFIVKTTWEEDMIHFEVFNSNDAENVWTGTISLEDLSRSAEELEIPYEDFLRETKEALGTNGGLKNFIYSIKEDKLIWQKNENFKITYGEVYLLLKENINGNFVSNLIDTIVNLKTALLNYKSNCEEIRKEMDILNESYSQCLEEKNSMERNLLGKFSLLLNSKKEKIRDLKHSIKLLPDKCSNGETTKERKKDAAENPPQSLPSSSSSGKNELLDLSQEIKLTNKIKLLPKRGRLTTEKNAKKSKIVEN